MPYKESLTLHPYNAGTELYKHGGERGGGGGAFATSPGVLQLVSSFPETAQYQNKVFVALEPVFFTTTG